MVRMLMNERERLHRYFDHELPEAERKAFEDSADHEVREKLAALSELRHAVKTTVDLQTANIDLVSGVERALARQESQRTFRRRARIASPLVALVAAAAAVMIWLRPTPIAPMTRQEPAAIESLEVEGALATVLELDGDEKNSPATVIFIEEDDKETL